MAEPPTRALALDSRSKAVIAALGLTIVGASLSLWADGQQTELLRRIADGQRVSFAEADASDDRVAWTAIVYGVGSLMTVITFLLWYSRAYRNVIAMGFNPRFGTRWAVWYWFIPIVALFRPKQVMNDIWRGSTGEQRVSPLLHWWWGLWIFSVWIGNFAFRNAFSDSQTQQELVDESQAYMFSDFIDVVTAVLAIIVVVKVTRRAEARRAQSRPDGERESETIFGVPEPPVYPQV